VKKDDALRERARVIDDTPDFDHWNQDARIRAYGDRCYAAGAAEARKEPSGEITANCWDWDAPREVGRATRGRQCAYSKEQHYPHSCGDGHGWIGFRGDDELCPVDHAIADAHRPLVEALSAFVQDATANGRHIGEHLVTGPGRCLVCMGRTALRAAGEKP
jgi:hypothetical protein